MISTADIGLLQYSIVQCWTYVLQSIKVCYLYQIWLNFGFSNFHREDVSSLWTHNDIMCCIDKINPINLTFSLYIRWVIQSWYIIVSARCASLVTENLPNVTRLILIFAWNLDLFYFVHYFLPKTQLWKEPFIKIPYTPFLKVFLKVTLYGTLFGNILLISSLRIYLKVRQ